MPDPTGVVIDGESYGHRPGHSLDDTDECAHWCEACRLERADREAARKITQTLETTTVPGIETLRDTVEWANWQREDHWLPEDGKDPTLAQIVQLRSLCLSWGVETPEDLATHDDPRARAAWDTWHAARGDRPTPLVPVIDFIDTYVRCPKYPSRGR
jgi:hypothetical protein